MTQFLLSQALVFMFEIKLANPLLFLYILVNQPFLVYRDGVDTEVQYGLAILKKIFPQMQLLLDPLIFHSSSQNVDGWHKNGMEIMSKSYPLSEIILLSHCSDAGKISNTRTM